MRLDVIGAGAMGSALARLLHESLPAAAVRLIDRDPAALAGVADGIAALACDDLAALELAPTVLCAAPWGVTASLVRRLARDPVDGGILISLSRPPQAEVPQLHALLDGLQGSVAVFPCGLEPGLVEILAAHLVDGVDQVASLRLRCGGIVVPRPANPLGYKRLFGTLHLPLAMQGAVRIRDGRLVQVPRFSDPQPVDWPGIGRLEAWHDGMQPRLAQHPKLSAAGTDVEQRTLRWPGYAAFAAQLGALGVLAEDAADPSTGLTPKQLFERAAYRALTLRDDEHSATLLSLELAGSKDGHAVSAALRLRFPDRGWLRSMALATCLPVVVLLEALLEAPRARHGWQYPEAVLTPDRVPALLERLRAHGTVIESEGACAPTPSSS